MVTIVYSRTIQGFLIGFADAIPLHWAVRGGGIGVLMSLQLCIVPITSHNYSGAVLLLAAGVLYGLLADGIATRLVPGGKKSVQIKRELPAVLTR